MQSTHRNYLEAMGITVWQVRQAGAVSLPVEDVDQVQQNPVQGVSTAGRESAASRLALVKQQLATADGEKSASKQPQAEKRSEVSAATPNQRQSSHGRSSAEFLMFFLTYRDCCFVVSLSYDAATLPAQHKGFLDDVYFAIGKRREAARLNELRWPLARAAHIKPSEEETRQAVLMQVPKDVKQFVIFGETAAQYAAGGVKPISSMVEHEGSQFVFAADIQRYFEQPTTRSELWHCIRQLVSENDNE